MLPYTLDATLGEFVPGSFIFQNLPYGFYDFLFVQRIDQIAIVTIADNISWPTILGCNNGHPACSRFNQSKPKGFGQCGVNKYPLREGYQSIKNGNVIRLMMFWIGHLTV